MSAKRIIHSHESHAVDLVGPIHIDPSWQAPTEGGFDLACFEFDWGKQVLTCPVGRQSKHWFLAKDAQGEPIAQILFAPKTCQDCSERMRSTRTPANR